MGSHDRPDEMFYVTGQIMIIQYGFYGFCAIIEMIDDQIDLDLNSLLVYWIMFPSWL